jgi:hypothetical protein
MTTFSARIAEMKFRKPQCQRTAFTLSKEIQHCKVRLASERDARQNFFD